MKYEILLLFYLRRSVAPPRGATTRSWRSGRAFAFQFTPLREGRRVAVRLKGDLAISIHAPPRGATTYRPTARASSTYFNSRPSARGDSTAGAVGSPPAISIHAPPRGATSRERLQRRRSGDFNSRPSARGDWLESEQSEMPFQFQFTPLREGRRLEHARAVVVLIISIHAPPRGATHTAGAAGSPPAISIHAPPRGATSTAGAAGSPPAISIHAPPRGATTPPEQLEALRRFQFTPLREGRLMRRVSPLAASVFQFTPLREGRHFASLRSSFRKFQFTPLREGRPALVLYCQNAIGNFNSRPSARGDAFGSGILDALSSISIHAPPRGATLLFHRVDCAGEFQFTPLREGRRQKICNFCKSFVQPLQISMA